MQITCRVSAILLTFSHDLLGICRYADFEAYGLIVVNFLLPAKVLERSQKCLI